MRNTEEYRYRQAKKRIEALRSFYSHAIAYATVIGLLALFNYYTTDFPWVIFPAIGWGIGLIGHGLGTFGHHLVLGKKWEERKLKELLDRTDF